jgi:hypothetical protein
MPLLAFVSNPPPPRPNPIRFTGPSLTLMPFNPFQKVSVDLFGASFQPKQKNPYKQSGQHWEVPEALWPENMKPKAFDALIQSKHNLDVRKLVSGRFKVPAYGAPDGRLTGVNESRASRGLPMLTHEEWRRWVILDVIGQLHEEAEIKFSRPPVQPYPGAEGPEFLGGSLPYLTRSRPARRAPGPVEPLRVPSHAGFRSPGPMTESDVAEARSAEERSRRSVAAAARREAERERRSEQEVRIAAMRAELERRQQGAQAGATETATAKATAMLRGLDTVYAGDRDDLAYDLGLSEQRLREFMAGRYLIPADLAHRIATLARDKGVRVANPRDVPRKRNRDHRWRKPPEEIEVPLEEIKNLPGYKKAAKAFKRFHKTDPKNARIIRVPDGRKETTLANDGVHVFLGHREQTPYTVPFGSKKDVRWYHDHPAGERPSILLDPETGLVTDVGGTYMVDDWFYS